jgi:hypothetical protein
MRRRNNNNNLKESAREGVGKQSCPFPCLEGMQGEQLLQVYLFITLVLNGDEWSLPCPSCSTHCIWGRVVPRAGRLRLKCDDGTRAETRLRLSAKQMSPFKSAGASVQSTTSSRGVHISGSNGSNPGYTMFWGSVKSTGYPFHLPVSPSIPLPCVTVCHHISTGLYKQFWGREKSLAPAGIWTLDQPACSLDTIHTDHAIPSPYQCEQKKNVTFWDAEDRKQGCISCMLKSEAVTANKTLWSEKKLSHTNILVTSCLYCHGQQWPFWLVFNSTFDIAYQMQSRFLQIFSKVDKLKSAC